MHKVGMRLISIHVTVLNMVSKPKCRNLHNVQLVFVSVKKQKQRSIIIFIQTRIMVDGAKFNIHDSGSHFKKSTFKNGY